MPDIATHGGTNESLPELLSRRARRLSDRRLAIDAGAGLVVAAATAIWQPPGWIPLLGAALAVSGLGVWGILDRELTERVTQHPDRGGALRVGRGLAALVSAGGALLLLLSLLAVALGTWIS